MCGSKICSKCGIEKLIDQFYNKKNSKDGHQSECKTCHNLRRYEYIEQLVYIETIEKYCKRCNTTKSVTEFYKNKRIKDGYSSACKQCSDKSKKNRASNFVKPSKNIIEKQCSKCNIIKSVLEFHIDRYSKDSYSTNCKDCANERTRNNVIIYDNVTHSANETKRCYCCKEIKSISEFYLNKKRKDGLTSICKTCSTEHNRNHRHKNPELYKTYDNKRRNFGYNSINKMFNWSVAHHLHLENNHDFVIQIPFWLHRLYSHNSYTGKNMQTMNAITLDFWINEDSIYKNLYEL